MKRSDRARQFQPFDALKGLKEALRLKEYEHERIAMGEITEDKAKKISEIFINIEDVNVLEITYFSDGYYLKETGNVKLSIIEGYIKINNKKVLISDIYDVNVIA